MTDRATLIAFLATLGAIVILFGMSAVCLAYGRSVEAIGIGGIMTGLIGVLGAFRPSPKPTVNNAETVNVSEPNK